MEFRICPTTTNAGETQACFNQNLLQRSDGGGSRVTVDGPRTYTQQFRLPANLRCSRCVVQWNYRAGKDWCSLVCILKEANTDSYGSELSSCRCEKKGCKNEREKFAFSVVACFNVVVISVVWNLIMIVYLNIRKQLGYWRSLCTRSFW